MSDFDAEKCMKPIKRKHEELDLGNGSVKRFDVSLFIPYEMGVASVIEARKLHSFNKIVESLSAPSDYALGTGRKPEQNRQRCKYCGCLVSNFDIHCSSCGAPI